MFLIHGKSVSDCIKRALDIVLTESEHGDLTIFYVNGTISDKLFYLVKQSKLSNKEAILKQFNYEKVDDIVSLKSYLSGIDCNRKTIVIVEGLLQILSNGFSDYTEKNCYLVEILMTLKKSEANHDFKAIILDELNYFVSLHCSDLIKVS
ncbi:hypothetical protein CLIB1423_08S03048 [[Candida] railenensis]|uniref:Uncharacterized protein n=1 Tax=[Candida] railenensis TaxID=45579 RepID=A0A9P0QQN0_9ASCO|nr:hypothetical protein CLIB1423_08S03048 [[Candida] railenensis]